MTVQPIDPARLLAIAATLNQEMCRPIDQFRADLDQFLNNPAVALSAADRQHALTIRNLCDELRTLTEECLGAQGRAVVEGLRPPAEPA